MKKIVFTLISIIIILVFVEFGLHVIDYITRENAKERPRGYLRLSYYNDRDWAPQYWREFFEALNKDFVPFLTWNNAEYHGKYINIDQHFVRKTWNPEKNHTETPKVIYTFGGSTMWGTGARDDYTIASQMSKVLHQNGIDAIVKNYGEVGYNFQQEIIQLILLLREGHIPDYAIFYDGVNDVYGSYQHGRVGAQINFDRHKERFDRKVLSSGEHLKIWLSDLIHEKFMIYKAVSRTKALVKPQTRFTEVASSYGEAKAKEFSREIVENYLKSMELLDKLSKAYGFKYLCLWQPVTLTEKKLTEEEEKLTDYRISDRAIRTIYMTAKEILSETDRDNFFNIWNVLAERKKLFYIDFCHLTEEGNMVVAEKIVSILKDKYFPESVPENIGQ